MNQPENDSPAIRLAYRASQCGSDDPTPSSVHQLRRYLPCEEWDGTRVGDRIGWPEYAGLVLASATSADDTESPGGDSARAPSPEDTDALTDPDLPMANDSELEDADAREQFLDQALGFRDVRVLFREGWTLSDLVAFNVRERFRIIGHDPKKHRLIGRLVAKAKDHSRDFLESEVTSLFLSALAKPMTRRKHRNVLEHVAEFVTPKIDAQSSAELSEAITAFARGETSRHTSLVLLRRHVEEIGIAGLCAQSYLYPDEILLRFLEDS